MQNGTLLAAIDLGSNSFRLEIGRLNHGQIHRTEYLKETVRQGNGLDADRNLTQDAMQRGWDCLARFAERLAGFRKHQVRAVATQTLREARNRDAFLQKANQILGFPIEVIAGREEARMIYQGVAHLLPQSPERRLVIDIGGRSTELILGQNLHAEVMGLDHPLVQEELGRMRIAPPEDLGIAVAADVDDPVLLSFWMVEASGKNGERRIVVQPIAVKQDGTRVPAVERHCERYLQFPITAPRFTPDQRLEMFSRTVEPTLQRELKHKGTANGDGSYSAELVGYAEILPG